MFKPGELPDREELISGFEFVGQKLKDNDVIDYCLFLCGEHVVAVEEFVEHWLTFSVTTLKNAPVTLENLRLFKEELSELGHEIALTNHEKYGDPYKDTYDDPDPKYRRAEEACGLPEPLKERKLSPVVVKFPSQNGDVSGIEDSRADYSYSDGSQLISQQSYNERKDAGDVVATFGDLKDLTSSKQVTTVEIISKSKWYDLTNFKYLNLTQMKVSNAFCEVADSLGRTIMKIIRLDTRTNENDSNDVICGKIRPEDLARLNRNNIIIEGSYGFNGAKVYNLNIRQTDSYSLFPGQIAAVQGLRTGNSFLPERFYTQATPEQLDSAPQFIEDLNIVIAAGPYSTCENMLFEPIQDLLKFVVQKKPSVVILLGPFTDVDEKLLDTINETMESYFDSLIDTIMETITLAGPEIKVVLVSSPKDLHFLAVFPTPAYSIKQKYPNLICAPNPCLLNINGLVIGALNVDVLFHLTKEELSKNPTIKDRMTRLASHLIDQRSFYPLYPSDRWICVDYERLLNDCSMTVKPHILILPSTLRYFIKEGRGCVFINPERLVKNRIGGTFATVTVKPSEEHNIVKNISCQIRKI